MSLPDHPLLRDYWPSERKAIWVHKYYMGIERGYDPSMDEVVSSWERDYARDWRSRKMQRDAHVQLDEIEAHRNHMCREKGREVSFLEAARDWVYRHEAQWRRQWEEQPAACP